MRPGRQQDAVSGDDVARLLTRAASAEACVASGRHAAAERMWREAAAALARRYAVAESTSVRLMLVRHLLERARAGEAERTCADAARMAHAAGHHDVAASAGVWEAAALTDLGRLTQAETLCRTVLDAGHLPEAERSRGLATLVRVRLWQGRLDEAAAAADGLGRAACPHDAFVASTLVRLHLARRDVFAAGLVARVDPAASVDARPVDRIIRATTGLRLCAAIGDIDEVLRQCVRLRRMAADAHLPLRALRAQVIAVQALTRAGHAEARRWAARVGRFEHRVPPLLGRAIAEASGFPASGARTSPRCDVAPDSGAQSRPTTRTVPAPTETSSLSERDSCDASQLVPELVGVSEALGELRRAVVKIAAAPFAVLVEGESGVGKELVARALHRLGPRRAGPFRDLNCAALPEDLLDSELFGHRRGAFTGAIADRRGLFEEADGGTLFLDEVADLSIRGQAKLLRVLQEREVRRVGEAKGRPVDVRVVSAANREMRAEAASGAFRPDLLYRLDVIRLRIPPLRARPEDVVPLALHFWADASGRVGSAAVLTREVLEALASHSWPGNVRELQNAMAALAVAAPTRGEVRVRHLSLHGQEPAPRPSRLDEARAQFERRLVQEALARAGGNRAGAARALGVTRQGLAKLMVRLRIDAPPRS
jgi:DNA-binding NtrC family response regulator